MSRLFPHAPYAEDQPLAHLILTTHVLHRGFQSGALFGILLSPLPLLYHRFYPSNPGSLSSTSADQIRNVPSSTLPRPVTSSISYKPQAASFWRSTLLSWTGMGGIIGFGAVAVMLPMMMRGKEEIEWQDRAWRLLANRGQVEVDEWSLCGVGAGVVGVMWARSREFDLQGWRSAGRVVGRAGLGSLAGIGGLFLWRTVVPRGE
jgi:hypothetical protein